MDASWLALTVATFSRSALPLHLAAMPVIASQATAAAALMPRWTATALAPLATVLRPRSKIAAASTVAAVVPSPARSAVFLATCWTIFAPMFSKGEGRSISLATLTPSLVTEGPPYDFSMTTLWPAGPMVTATAEASFSTPALNSARAAASNFICLVVMSGIPVGYWLRRRDAVGRSQPSITPSSSLSRTMRCLTFLISTSVPEYLP